MKTIVAVILLVACQTRSQAKITAIGAGAIGAVGGYFEYRADGRRDGLPPFALIGGGAIAIVSAISMLFLDEEPHILFDSSPAVWKPAVRRGNAELLLAMQRTSCFGTCPIYTVAIYRDGVVEFRGEGYVRTQGTVLTKISENDVHTLEAAFVEAKFTSFDGDLDRCLDSPHVLLWYRRHGGPTKSVEHDLCSKWALAYLEQLVDTTVDVDSWIRPK